MKKLSSIELFRWPNHNHYSLIEGSDYLSSGIVTIRSSVFSPGTNFKSKGILQNNEGATNFSLEKDVSNVSLFKASDDFDMNQIIESYIEGGEELYPLKLTTITRKGGIYGRYKKGFVYLPAYIMEFIVKAMSRKEKLVTNGRAVFLVDPQSKEYLVSVETMVEPDFSEEETDLLATLNRRAAMDRMTD